MTTATSAKENQGPFAGIKQWWNSRGNKETKSTFGGNGNWFSKKIAAFKAFRARKVAENQQVVQAEAREEKETGSNESGGVLAMFAAGLNWLFIKIIWKLLIRTLIWKYLLVSIWRFARFAIGAPLIDGNRYIAVRNPWKVNPGPSKKDWKAFLFAPISKVDIVVLFFVLLQVVWVFLFCNGQSYPSHELVMFTLGIFFFSGIFNTFEIVSFFYGVLSAQVNVKEVRYSIIGNAADIVLSFAWVFVMLLSLFISADQFAAARDVMVINYKGFWIIFIVQWLFVLVLATDFIAKPALVWIFAKLITKSTTKGTTLMPQAKPQPRSEPEPVVESKPPAFVEPARKQVETPIVPTSSFGSSQHNGNRPSWSNHDDDEEDESFFDDDGDMPDTDDLFGLFKQAVADRKIIGSDTRGAFDALKRILGGNGIDDVQIVLEEIVTGTEVYRDFNEIARKFSNRQQAWN